MARGKQRTARHYGTELDARLDNYSTVAGVSGAATGLRSRLGNWPIYAAAAGSALAMATNSSASIITSGIVSGSYQSVSVNPQGPNQLALGFSGPTVKLAATSGSGPFAALSLRAGNKANIFVTHLYGASSVKNFALGSPITGTAANAGEVVKANFTGKIYGDFISGVPGFAGLSITSNHQNLEYGWIELVFTEKNSLPNTLSALAFGIDTNPHQTLEAGQIDNGFIPEPGTMSLALLASGAAGVIALRRRRKQPSVV